VTSRTIPRDPDFSQFLKVLRREPTDRPTLFEFYLNGPLYERLAGRPAPIDPGAVGGHAHAAGATTAAAAGRRNGAGAGRAREEMLAGYRALGRWYADAFGAAGYDYVNFGPSVAFPGYHFREGAHEEAASHSLNDQPLVTTWEDLERFPWPDPALIDPGIIDALTADLPAGMEAMVFSPSGVLENLVDLTGYDNLCFMLVDDRDLVRAIADRIGESLLALYRAVGDHPRLGAMISNDDWGFKTQTMISPDDLREFVYPAHRETVRIAHAAGKPILLHSCGELREVMGDLVVDLGYDAKHSFEDVIEPVEDVYERWGDRIAILGGIDVGFLCTSSSDEITRRSRAMIERTQSRGGYALGSGNSIPEYVPQEAYFAMIRAALDG
jgi:uroporphyrinogen decarboxylase